MASHHGAVASATGLMLFHHFSLSLVVQMTTASGNALQSSSVKRKQGTSAVPTYPSKSSCRVRMTYASLVLGGLGLQIEIHPLMNSV